MNFYRCKCGLEKANGNKPFDCEGCAICKTTLELDPDIHDGYVPNYKTPMPHFYQSIVDSIHASKLKQCTRCGHTIVDVHQEGYLDNGFR